MHSRELAWNDAQTVFPNLIVSSNLVKSVHIFLWSIFGKEEKLIQLILIILWSVVNDFQNICFILKKNVQNSSCILNMK